MSLRLGDYVIYGEVTNIRNYSTVVYLGLRGEEPDGDTAMHIELTGNCNGDLRGKHIRFRPDRERPDDAVFRPDEHPGVQMLQVGPTGTMTAQGWVRDLPCSVEEFLARSRLGEIPPTTWTRHLYLEWYGQNGRGLVEMAGAIVEECVREPKGDDEGDWIPLPNLAPMPGFLDRGDDEDSGDDAGPDVTIIQREGDDVHVDTLSAAEALGLDGGDPLDSIRLQRQLDAEADAIDRMVTGEPGDAAEATRDLELMDHCIDHGEERPLESIFPGSLPPMVGMSDERVESELKAALARMAMLGIALDVCPHYSVRDCYRLLREEILPESGFFEELTGTGWVQHVSTWEHCEDCEARAEED